MNFYTVYSEHKDTSRDLLSREIVLVKEGFNWQSFIFGIFWALYKRIWPLVAIYACIIVMIVILSVIEWFGLKANLLILAGNIILAFQANDFYRNLLEKKGMECKAITYGKTEDDATLRFMDRSYE